MVFMVTLWKNLKVEKLVIACWHMCRETHSTHLNCVSDLKRASCQLLASAWWVFQGRILTKSNALLHLIPACTYDLHNVLKVTFMPKQSILIGLFLSVHISEIYGKKT